MGSAAMASRRAQRESLMKFLFMIRSAHEGAPPAALIEAIGALAEQEAKLGRMLDMGGLMPPAAGGEVQIRKGKIMVTDGPFVEAKEVIGGYAVFELSGKEEALASARDFMQLHLDHFPEWEGTCEIRAFTPDAPCES
jgi:hypothetical protein